MPLRLAIFLVLLTLLALAERAWPHHVAPPRRRQRWPANLGMGAIDVVFVRVLVPWAAVDAAGWGAAHGFGALHLLALPVLASGVIGFLALDLAIYLQHRLMHNVNWLWRLHRMHHSDLAIDASSGVRFHPAEIVLSMGIKIGIVLLLGIAAPVVMIFELALSSFSLFSHTNLAIPARVDRWLRWMIVTPDMHRIHHSVLREEHDSNYGFQLSWWDRLLGSYRTAPGQPQATLMLGLDQFRDAQAQRFTSLLRQPLRPLD